MVTFETKHPANVCKGLGEGHIVLFRTMYLYWIMVSNNSCAVTETYHFEAAWTCLGGRKAAIVRRLAMSLVEKYTTSSFLAQLHSIAHSRHFGRIPYQSHQCTITLAPPLSSSDVENVLLKPHGYNFKYENATNELLFEKTCVTQTFERLIKRGCPRWKWLWLCNVRMTILKPW